MQEQDTKDDDFNDAVVSVGPAKVVHSQYSTHNPRFPGGKYNAIRAMESRYCSFPNVVDKHLVLLTRKIIQ